MKLDKEFLAKNRFWVLLAVAAPLALVAIFFLMVVVPGAIGAIRKKNEADYKTIKEFKKDKNDKWVRQAAEKLGEVKKQEKEVWETAWLAQEEMFSWPGYLDESFKQGYFIKTVTIHPKDAKGAEKLDPPEVESRYQGIFHGKILDADSESVRVVSLKKTGKPVVRKFLNPGEDKALIVEHGKESAKLTFANLGEAKYKDAPVVISYEKGKAYGDALTFQEQKEFTDTYLKQIVPLLREVGPLNELKEPLVQFKNWVYSEKPKELFFLSEGGPGVIGNPMGGPRGADQGGGKDNRGAYEFFPYVPKEWKTVDVDKSQFDSSKDAWTFQENLWVTRELFRQLRTVNDDVAAFQATNKPSGPNAIYSFKNPYWEMKFQSKGDGKVEVTIKNLLDRRQQLPGAFKVKIRADELEKDKKTVKKTAPFVKLPPLKSPPLAAAGVVEEGVAKDTHTQVLDLRDDIKGENLEGVFAVEQVLNWETAGVKRIDAIHIGLPRAQSHRTMLKELKSFFPAEKKEEETTKEGPGKELPNKGMQLGGLGAGGVKTTVNGMVLDRFLDVTPQSRRLPVALVVIVDQDQVYRVQAALADCKFRFLTTQVVMNRYPDSMRPPKKTEGTGGLESFQPPSMPDDPNAGVSNQLETNVELVIYGVITLYERYPPRPTAPSGS